MKNDDGNIPKTEKELEEWMKANCANFDSYSINGNAIAIKAYDGGPVLYSQKRLTTGGRVVCLNINSSVSDSQPHYSVP